ncbi:ABC transporter ATP-binding protein [Planktothrix sp. FACHB-1355]|uniref:ABC transporter ATP-binding protein n=1 Tax=Aerosakkonema funiforme FACHB-1375 TaxID=2949571 RepID=A0A926VDG6_9CYAN|nr:MULTISPECIES: ABC transporter ATP-binding protein [Oscillatoriales]MBD2181338.1 ABC transporter ATP-binding protein [Aerosakkonema funiforme FACHB-1375]MBD3557560.1 ABC transporter ATP-binding protein [Planktothrix sp. FACHB-1355]
MGSWANNLITRLKKTVYLICNYAKIFCRSIPLLWKAAPRETIFLAIALLLQSFIPAIAVWINKQVVDTVADILSSVKEYNFWTLGSLVSLWVGTIFLESLLPPWVELAHRNISEKLIADLNLKIMLKANSFVDINRFEDSHFYDELQIIQEQSAYQPRYLLSVLTEGIPELFTIISMLVLVSPLGWWIPLLILATSLPQTYVSFKIQWDAWQALSQKSPQARRMQYYASLLLTDTYAKEVRLFGLGSLFTQRYLEAFQDKYQTMRRLRGKQAFAFSGFAALSAAGNAFAFYSVVQQAFTGKLTPGSVMLFIQSLAYIQQNLTYLLHNCFILQETLLFMERFFKFLISKNTMSVTIPAKPVPYPIESGIVFENVNFAYPDGRLALAGISFTLHPGEIVALVGENGAGKTTLVKLLARLYDPTGGNISVDGESLKNFDIAVWRRQIGVLFQDFCRYSLTIAENISLGDIEAMDDLERLKKAAEKSGIADKVESLPEQYFTLLGKQFGGTELSGGEWQKLALARAFVREEGSQILILDEPTAALDPRSEYEIYSHFFDLVRGKTAILVTHRLASVKMADRILVLKAGKLIEEGTHEQLLEKGGEYATLWNMQVEQYKF